MTMFPKVSSQFDRAPQVRRMEALTPWVVENRKHLLEDEELYQRDYLRHKYHQVESRYQDVVPDEDAKQSQDEPPSWAVVDNTVKVHKVSQTVVLGGDKRVLQPMKSMAQILKDAKSGRFLRKQKARRKSAQHRGMTVLPEYELPAPAVFDEKGADGAILTAMSGGAKGLYRVTEQCGGDVERHVKSLGMMPRPPAEPATARVITSNRTNSPECALSARTIAAATGGSGSVGGTNSGLTTSTTSIGHGGTGRLISTPKGKLRPLMGQSATDASAATGAAAETGADTVPTDPSASLSASAIGGGSVMRKSYEVLGTPPAPIHRGTTPEKGSLKKKKKVKKEEPSDSTPDAETPHAETPDTEKGPPKKKKKKVKQEEPSDIPEENISEEATPKPKKKKVKAKTSEATD